MRAVAVAAGLAAAPALAASQPAPQGMAQYVSPAPSGMLERARRMMAAGNYGGAVDELRTLLLSGAPMDADVREQCDYMLARSVYERGEEGCVALLEDFAFRYPASARTPEVRLMTADHYYFAHEFGPAARIYSEADIDGLDSKSRALYTFRKGVSLTKAGEFGKARQAFGSLLSDSGWRQRARFYMAYIEYLGGDSTRPTTASGSPPARGWRQPTRRRAVRCGSPGTWLAEARTCPRASRPDITWRRSNTSRGSTATWWTTVGR